MGFVRICGVVADLNRCVLGQLAQEAMCFGVGERRAAEVAAVVTSVEREVERGFDLSILESRATLGCEVLRQDDGVEQLGSDDGPVSGDCELALALALAKESDKPVEHFGIS